MQREKEYVVGGLAWTRIQNVTNWLRQYGHRGLIGEFDGPETSDSTKSIIKVMKHANDKRDV